MSHEYKYYKYIMMLPQRWQGEVNYTIHLQVGIYEDLRIAYLHLLRKGYNELPYSHLNINAFVIWLRQPRNNSMSLQ